MAFQATENASSSSSSSIPPSSTLGRSVFLSFRGTDTRKNFTDHLYYRLKQEGISTFRDDERLKQGAEIVLSKQYASSSWCLRELEKIVECMDMKKLTVLPVFHYVDPSDVRYQGGSFAEAFAKHENRFKDDDVKTWRAALTEVANLSGWHLKDNSESEVIKKIIQRINSELNPEGPFFSEILVGMDSRMNEILRLCLGGTLNCVRLVGICGIGGIGKTTLAREIYNGIFHDFEASSFIADVGEQSESRRLVSLQKNILSKILMGAEKNISDVEEGKKILKKSLCNKKVLIVLDDVDKLEQLEALAGKDEWFGVGSIIIVTTRNKGLLIQHGVEHIYEPRVLNCNEAMALFSWKAFKKPHPIENYVDLSINFLSHARGHPLLLEVLGSSLFGRSQNFWESTLGRIEKEAPYSFEGVLKICFDGLEEREKNLFLDIACIFKGVKINSRLTHMLEKLYEKPEIYIDILQKKSLITITREGFQMHDLLQGIGRKIVGRHELGKEIACHRESPEEVARRSRL